MNKNYFKVLILAFKGYDLYTAEQVSEAIDFGIELGQTAGFFEGNDSWIEKQVDKFFTNLDSNKPNNFHYTWIPENWYKIFKK